MESPPIIYEMIGSPASTLIGMACVVVWLYTIQRNITFDKIAFSYERVIIHKEYWRVITSSFAHSGPLHLIFNLSALWSVKNLELLYGSVVYLKISFLLMIFSLVGVAAVYHIFIYYLKKEEYLARLSVGYSCVLFGLMTVYAQLSARSGLQILSVNIPLSLAPFASLIVTTLLIPQASLIGHLSGIIVGYFISWGFFDWFSNYFFFCTVLWLLILLVWNVNATTSWKFPASNFWDKSVHIHNGVIVHAPSTELV